MPENALQPVSVFRDLLERSRGQIAAALPRHLTPERMIRVALTALQRSPRLLECEPISVVACVIQASELGLELSGPLGQAYLVPYRNNQRKCYEAQFQVGYRGLIQLAHRSGDVTNFAAHCVHENDSFEFCYGTEPKLRHQPAAGNRGDITHVYAVLLTRWGGRDFEVLSRQDIEEHRRRYSRQSREDSPWQTAWEEMAKKTVIRRLAKRAPLSVECQTALAADERAEPAPWDRPDVDAHNQLLEAPTEAEYQEQTAREPGAEG